MTATLEANIFGTHDEKTLEQLRDVASRAERVALMADGHLRGAELVVPQSVAVCRTWRSQ
jgi:hypothetical protein